MHRPKSTFNSIIGFLYNFQSWALSFETELGQIRAMNMSKGLTAVTLKEDFITISQGVMGKRFYEDMAQKFAC